MRSIADTEWSKVRVHGRTNGKRPITLFYSGSAVECNVKAANLAVKVNAGYEYCDIWITTFVDGAIVSRQMLVPGEQTITVFRKMNPDKVKNVRIVRETEAIPDDTMHYLQILDFETDGELCEVPKRPISIEFIGDSITTGEGTYGAKCEEDWIPMFFSAYHNYAFMTAEALNADYRVISKGGWGIYSGWDNNVTCSIPKVYSKVCGLLPGAANEAVGAQEEYDFAANPVDLVVFHLGTNDYSAFTQNAWTDPVSGITYKQNLLADGTPEPESKERFMCTALEALKDIRTKNPNAPILWIYGMLGDGLKPLILESIDLYRQKTGDEQISYLDLPNTTDETVGSRFHPGYPAHKEAVKVLVPAIREILK